MTREQIEARDIRDDAVLAAMRTAPRHEFVPAARRDEAYEDHAGPPAAGQTVRQPYIVASMTESARVPPGGKVLDNGDRSELVVKVGDRVLFTSYGGTDVKYDGDDYLIMHESDILGVIG